MVAVSRLKIKNFRSIKNFEIDLRKKTIIVGQNDVGKSNILRALNLFFTGYTDEGKEFRFDDDVCLNASPSSRKRGVEIELDIELPSNYQNVNGDIIRWRKSWLKVRKKSEYWGIRIGRNRLGNKTEEKIELKSSSNVHHLLERINYVYVPAIKGSGYWERLRGDIFDLIAEVATEDFRDSSRDFELSIANQLKKLTEDIGKRLQLNTRLTLPNDLRHVFERLDFRSGDNNISLDNRGDGVKARHIPLILKFMADKKRELNSKGTAPHSFIWGYEEPENNIEMAKCYEMSKDFDAFIKKGVEQIILSTHSPVFCAVNNELEEIVHHIAWDSNELSTVPRENLLDLHGEMGFAEFVSPYIMKAQKEYAVLKENVKHLTQVINEGKPTIFVEGKSDRIILKRCLNIYYPNYKDQLCIDGPNSGGGANYVRDNLMAWYKFYKHKTNKINAAGLYDNDDEGRTVKKKSIDELNSCDFCKTYNLQTPPHLYSLMKKTKNFPISIEECLSKLVWKNPNHTRYFHKRVKYHQFLVEDDLESILASGEGVLNDIFNDNERLYLMTCVRGEKKGALASKIKRMSIEDAKEALRHLLPSLNEVLSHILDDFQPIGNDE